MKLIGGLLLVFLLSVQGSALADVDLDDIKLPRGFKIEIYAHVPNARSLALGDSDVVFVSNRRAKSVYALVPSGDANPQVIEVARNLQMPNGIAFHNNNLYVAEMSRVLVFRNIMSRITQLPAPEVVDIQLPGEAHHGWRYIGFGPDNKLYIAIGAPCNICDRDDEGFAQIWRMNADGSGKEVSAILSGLRGTPRLARCGSPIMAATCWATMYPRMN